LGVVGMGSLETTAQLSAKIGVGYPLALGPLTLEAGGAATFTTLQWENNNGDTGSSQLWSLLVNARANYPMSFADGFSLTGEVGLGVLNFSGISTEAAPVFLEPGKVADGSPSMFHVRLAVGAEYSFLPNLAATFSPVFAYSPAKDGFREDISSITRFDLLLGLAYKL
ncbi:MAG: hypothetical protein KJO07_01705, partial [Deltaproteobacteria bacterium]|nr:hypothetical protein [Deltaproteobacteria bacterium]